MDYELIPHTADLKIRAYGVNLQELFANAMKGMFAAIKPQGSHITYQDETPIVHKFTSERHLVVHAPDQELLLIDFLSECLYLSDIHNEAYFDIRFNALSQTEVDARIFGVAIDGFEVVEIKAVTYHDLELVKVGDMWRATIVFDI